MFSPRRIGALVFATVLLASLGACGGGASQNPAVEGNPPEQTKTAEPPDAITTLSNGEKAAFHGEKDVSRIEAPLELELADNYFEPTIIEGESGQKVTLKMSNTGNALHNISLSEQGINLDLPVGAKDVTTAVTIPQSGGLVFICKYHLAQNMRGELRSKSG